MRNKPKKSLFKQYDDAKHLGLFIPVGRKKMMRLYDSTNDILLPPAEYRMHFCITIKVDNYIELRMREIRVRIGFQYL